MIIVDFTVLAIGLAVSACAVRLVCSYIIGADAHRGADLTWRPSADMPEPTFTPVSLLATETRYEVRLPSMEALLADTEHAVRQWLDTALRDARARLDVAVQAAAFAG